MSEPLLVTITFSHYCEKVRWALDRAGLPYRESGHLPFFHAHAVRRAGGKRRVPVLVTSDRVINDSTHILAWLDEQAPQTHLFGRNEAERREIERLEERFDEHLGPHTRRWGYFYLLPRRDLVLDMARSNPVPDFEKKALAVAFPLARAIMRAAMNINADGAQRSEQKIDQVFAEVGELLADGRKFLVGDGLSAADITFASLAAPVVAPPQYAVPLPRVEDMPAEAQERIRVWQNTPAGEFARRMFRDYRR